MFSTTMNGSNSQEILLWMIPSMRWLANSPHALDGPSMARAQLYCPATRSLPNVLGGFQVIMHSTPRPAHRPGPGAIFRSSSLP